MPDTVTLTIDGREVQVPEGASVLDAALKLDIHVPTLCHLEGTKPLNSCFICLVQVEGEETLSPACSTRAVDGMVVRSECEEVREARRTGLELLLSEHHGDCEGPCTIACPAGLDVPTMIDHVTAGDVAGAVAAARERILFNAVLGRICPAYCERACRRAQLDEAVSIAALQRFVGDAGIADAEHCAAEAAPPSGKKVAVIGAGPAGLTAAYYLLLAGHACTLFDGRKTPGGMWRHAIPHFRLPEEVVCGEIDVVRRLGAEFRMETALGGDGKLWQQVRNDFDAVLLATGASCLAALDCKGADLARPATEFLREVAGGTRVEAGPSVVVIGDGELAVDAARAAVRLRAESVTLVCDRPREKMRAPADHLDAAEAEGVHVRAGARVVSVKQPQFGKLHVVAEDDGGLFTLVAENVVAAGDRSADTELAATLGLDVTAKGIAVHPRTFATNLEGVFAAGECVRGPDQGVRAVAAGRAAAVAIDQFLKGADPTGETTPINVRMGRLTDGELAVVRRTADPAARTPDRQLEPQVRRTSFDEVSTGLTPEEALTESLRCVRCSCAAKRDCKLRRHATTYGARAGHFKGAHRAYARELSHPDVVYEPNKCILCGLCIRTAEEAGEKLGLSFLRRGFVTTVGVPFEERLAEGLKLAADRCVAVCPTGALAFKTPWEKKGSGPFCAKHPPGLQAKGS